MELEQGVAAVETEMTRHLSLYKKEKVKYANLAIGVKIVNLAISEVNNQPIQKAKYIASIKAEVGIWSTLLAKARYAKEVIEQKWKTLYSE